MPGRRRDPSQTAASSDARPGVPNELVVLLLASFALFASNAATLPLPPLDDCFYARKGVEMARSGGFFTVTWNGVPTFQNPPLQFWLLGRSFLAFGMSDFAARIPSILMGLGTLLGVFRIGVRLGGRGAALLAVALLAVSPEFIAGARRCMLDVPLAFWVTASFVVLIEGSQRPRLHLLLALPLAAGILTKSVLGLLPLLVFLTAALVHRELRPSLRSPWLWGGALLGLALGATWSVHQTMVFGPDALRAHYLGEVVERSTRPLSWGERILGYPLILVRHFQPLVLPAAAGLIWMARRSRRRGQRVVLALWALLPVVLYSLSSARSARYVFPEFPALALCAGLWLDAVAPRAGRVFARWVAPVLLLAGAVVFAVVPGVLSRQSGREFKARRETFTERIPPAEPLTYLGDHYWSLANPLLYYGERYLEPAAPSADEALRRAGVRASRLLMCDRERVGELSARAPLARVALESVSWVVIELPPGSATPSTGAMPAPR